MSKAIWIKIINIFNRKHPINIIYDVFSQNFGFYASVMNLGRINNKTSKN